MRDDGPFVLDHFEPAYVGAMRSGTLAGKVEAALAELRACRACPRDCGADRFATAKVPCRTGRRARVASAMAHFGEEDCLRGNRGSGTIFFAHCNLRCVFCQNWTFSQAADGQPYTAEEIAAIMLRLQGDGCHNINLVTPEHVAPQLVEAIALAAPEGLVLPIVYNTSGYDGLASLRLMDGLVDIYMPDFKLWSRAAARRLLRASDYPRRTREAIAEMHRQVGVLRFTPGGLACRGVLVRHLVMPGMIDEAAAIFAWLADHVSADTYVNIMDQYRPEHRVAGNDRYSAIDRRPASSEVESAFRTAREAGLWRFDVREQLW